MNQQISNPVRPLGGILITTRAKAVLHPHDVLSALYRHARGETNESTLPTSSGEIVRIVTLNHQTTTIVSLIGETEFSDVGAVDTWVCGYGCRSCG